LSPLFLNTEGDGLKPYLRDFDLNVNVIHPDQQFGQGEQFGQFGQVGEFGQYGQYGQYGQDAQFRQGAQFEQGAQFNAFEGFELDDLFLPEYYIVSELR
jgi:hypothetical protein